MIDLLTGKVCFDRFVFDKNTHQDDFKKKYVANYIKLNTHFFTNTIFKIGHFIASDAAISFIEEGGVKTFELTFSSDEHDFFADACVKEMLSSLSNCIHEFETLTSRSWQMSYGEVTIRWNNSASRNIVVFTINYSQWNFQFLIKNCFADMIWSLTKTGEIHRFCVYRYEHEFGTDDIKTQQCQLYSTRNDICKVCSHPCNLRKLWAIYNAPTYKELLAELPARIDIRNETEVEVEHAKLAGEYLGMKFVLEELDVGCHIYIDGNEFINVCDLLSIFDSIGHISSNWYRTLVTKNT